MPDVVIVGAGVIGCATAYYLSRAGASCVIVERDGPASGASGVAAGMLSPLAEGGPGPSVEMGLAGLELYRALVPTLEAETGLPVGWLDSPIIHVALTEEEARVERAEAEAHRVAGRRVEWLDGADLLRLQPGLAPGALGGRVSHHEAQLDAYRLTLAVAAGAERAGARILQREVIGLAGSDGRATGVRLRSGETVAGDAVVVAAGPWTPAVSDVPAIRQLPVHPLKGQILRGDLPDLRAIVFHGLHYVMPKAAGPAMVGTTQELVGFDLSPTGEARRSILEGAIRIMPEVAAMVVSGHVAGLRPASGDGLPIIGPAPGWEGLFVASGHGRRGILLGALTGQAIAGMLLGAPPSPFASAVSAQRFSP